MYTKTALATTTGNRLATQEEIEHARMMLLGLGESLIASLIKDAPRHELDEYHPLVVTNFFDVGNAKVLLVPAGIHALPQSILNDLRFIIGLPVKKSDYPTLRLTDIPVTEIYNFDTGKDHPIQVCDAVQVKFAALRLDAEQPTIIEVYINSPAFSDRFLHVECSAKVDIYNQSTSTLREEHAWAGEAYGQSMCRPRNVAEKVIDTMQDSGLQAIDAVFRPLVSFAEKIDKAMGWK